MDKKYTSHSPVHTDCFIAQFTGTAMLMYQAYSRDVLSAMVPLEDQQKVARQTDSCTQNVYASVYSVNISNSRLPEHDAAGYLFS